MFDGRYRIVKKIADGGMATVYLARDERLGRMVAIKIMHVQLAQGPHRAQFVERFRREAKSAAAIANPHIVQVYDSGEYAGLDYLVMEYVEGMNLRQRMAQQGTFSVRETLRVVAETLDGLAAAHNASVVHRDIKPENILLNRRGRVQITDFGLAKAVSQATLSTTGMLLGTAAYLAPEMIEQNLATAQGDCYSVGIMAWEMLTGQVPFHSDNPATLIFKHVNENVPSVATVCRGIDPKVADFISYLTARRINDRPETAEHALNTLRALMPTLSAQALDYRYDPSADRLNSLEDADVIGLSAHFATSDATSAQVHEMWKNNASATPQLQGTSAEDGAGTGAKPDSGSPRTAPNPADEPETVAMEQNGHQQVAATSLMPSGAAENGLAVDLPSPIAADLQDPNKAATIAAHSGVNQPRTFKSRRGLIAIIIGLAVAVLGSAGTALWYFIGPGSYWSMPQVPELHCKENVTCPITNVEWTTYETALKNAGISYTTEEAYSDTVKTGDVIATDPADVGAHVSKRNKQIVDVTISKGIRPATVPADILDPSSASGKDPIAALQNAGFTNIVHNTNDDQWSLDVPEGAAISITPDPGATVNHNDQVTVVLSKGPMPVNMPNVVGKTRSDAGAMLDALKLKATYTEEFSDNIKAGVVISTSVPADTQLKWGDSVTVTVSKGPQMVTLPDVVGKSTDEAKKTLEDLGLKVKVNAPLGDWTHTVRFQSPKAGESVRLHNEQGEPTEITLTIA